MINYAPIPLLEASLFLANQAAGVSWTSYMERTFGKGDNRPHNNTLASYSDILTELERRLRASITVPKDTIQTLFAPLYQRGKDKHHPSSGHVCSILIPNMVEAYVDWEEGEFFCRLKQNIQQMPANSGLFKLGRMRHLRRWHHPSAVFQNQQQRLAPKLQTDPNRFGAKSWALCGYAAGSHVASCHGVQRMSGAHCASF